MVLSWNPLTNSGGTGSSSARTSSRNPKSASFAGRLSRADQDETANAAWVAQRHSLGEKGSRRSTDDGRFFDPDRVHERIDIGGEVLRRVAAFGLVRVPVSALGEREGVVGGREQGEHPAEGEPGIGVAVEEDDGFPSSGRPVRRSATSALSRGASRRAEYSPLRT